MQEDKQQQQQRQWVSALADGQLDQASFTRTVEWVASSDEALGIWHAYHVVGDVLRCPDLGGGERDLAFLNRFRDRLAATGAVLRQDAEDASMRPPAFDKSIGKVEVVVSAHSTVEVANDASWRWKWIAAAASMMAVVVLGWHVSSIDTVQLATAPGIAGNAVASVSTPGAELPVMLRDERLDALLIAHRQFGGTSALQKPAGFLRNATFEPSARQ